MRKVLLDVNVALDVLLDRRPHSEPATALWGAIESGRATGFLPAHGLTTVHYLARRYRDVRFARQIVEDILTVFEIAAVDGTVLRRALALPFSDFEDAVCAACAVSSGCEVIVTRDPAGFRSAPLRVLDPASTLAWLEVAE